MNLVLISLILVLSLFCIKQLSEISNLKTQLFNFKIRYDLEARGGNLADEYSMEVPPPIPRMLQ